LLEIADKDNLQRDLRVYVLSVLRTANKPVHPFDFRRLVHEFFATLDTYAEGAGDAIDFHDAYNALSMLQSELDQLYAYGEVLADQPVGDPNVRIINDAILGLGRLLIPINNTRQGQFRNEPAVPTPPLPVLEPALALGDADGHEKQVLITHVWRGLNRVAWTFDQAAQIAKSANQAAASL
jgi:N-acetylated-alpha-linked acidic dipeptidase